MEIDRTQVVSAIVNRMDALHLRHAIVFDPRATQALIPYIPIAEALANRLAEGNQAAVVVARALVDAEDLTSVAFWATDLGRLLFLAGGFRNETVSQTIAAAVLGCSRQRVYQMIANGPLRTDAAREVYAENVQEVLKTKLAASVK